MKLYKSSVLVLAALFVSSLAIAEKPMSRITLHYAGTYSATQLKELASRMPISTKFIDEERQGPDRSHLPMNPQSSQSSSFPINSNDVFQKTILGSVKGHDPSPMFALGTGFSGPDRSATIDPPDTVGDVSPTQVFVATNHNFQVFDKSGTLGFINQTMDSFFGPGRVAGSVFTSDPRVRFDRTSGRWFFVCIDIPSGSGVNNRCIVVVSNNSTLNASSTFKYYWFQPRVATDLLDYPTLGVDNNAVYIGGNMFANASSFNGCDAYVLNKAPLLSGSTGPVSAFAAQVCPASGEGAYTPQGVLNADPATSEGYFVGVSNAVFGRLVVRRITNPGGVPSISSNLLVTVPTTAFPNVTVSTPGGGLDALDDRLFNAMYVNGSIWCAHNFRVTTAGVATNSGSLMGSRWYQLGTLSTTPTLVQAGTAFDTSGSMSYWIPSVAGNLQGHAALGSSRANSTTTPGSGYAVRNLTDTLGTMTAPALAHAGSGTFTPLSSRWGDYSHVVVDPSDGMTFWTFQTYVPTAGKWGTWVQQIKSNAPTVSTLSPNFATQGATLNVVVTGTGLFEPGVSYPNHLAASFGANITVNSVTYNSPTQATVNITIGGAAATGARTVTITNPDGQSVNSSFTVNVGLKTVTGALTLQSYAGPLLAGSQFVFEIRDASTNALIETDAATITAGNNFSFSTSLAAGNYKLRIKGVNRFLAKSQPITLTSTGATGLAYTLTNGDASGDNVVGIADFNLVRTAWGGVSPNAPYTVATDFNGDGVIGIADFNIMRTSWGAIGDN